MTQTESFIQNLLSQMTLEEKIGQLNQGGGDPETANQIRQGLVSSVIDGAGPLSGQEFSTATPVEQRNAVQRMALESRLKIPLILGRDIIHGYRTTFPIPLGLAATFDPDLLEATAAVAARETAADGIKWTFAPMLDIARDPRWGRVAEGNGEDPYLGSQMAAAAVRGFQGTDPADPNCIVACAKHYVGYGSAEGGRDYENGEISEPTLRDVYLPPFESAVKAGVGTVMSAFVDLNGIPATANRRLLTDVLRGEMGFFGFVISDMTSVTELIAHGVAEDEADAARLALHAGVDMDMVSGAYLNTLSASLQSGRVSLEEIDQAVLRVLRIKHRAGLFENPLTDPTRFSREAVTPAARQLARDAAARSMVLLKNSNNILPLKDFRKVLFAGSFVHARAELGGCWGGDLRPADITPLDEAIRQVAPKDVELRFAEDFDNALFESSDADAVVLLLGEHPRRSGENNNLADIGLPPGQAELVDAFFNMGKPIILVVFAGRPLVITRQAAQVDALIYAWHPGTEGGAALGELLFGQRSPSARLPITLPRATGQVPIYYNHKNSGRPLGSKWWFKSRYMDLPTAPLYPFGYGLTYTSFVYSDLQLSQANMRGSMSLSAMVTNTGLLPGSELAQLYVRDLVGSLTRPIRELKGFQRIDLKPGESQRVSFELNEEMLAFTRSDGTKGVEPGRYHVWIAPDSVSGLQGEFSI